MKKRRIDEEISVETDTGLTSSDHSYVASYIEANSPPLRKHTSQLIEKDEGKKLLGNGKNLNPQSRDIVRNVIKYFTKEKASKKPLLPLSQVLNRVHAATGLSLNCIARIAKTKQTYRESQLLCRHKVAQAQLPVSKEKVRKKCPKAKLDDFSTVHIRRIMHRYFKEQKHITIQLLLCDLKLVFPAACQPCGEN